MHTHDFSLADTVKAIRATEGSYIEGSRALHVAVLPWS
jgi:hypothetical protein